MNYCDKPLNKYVYSDMNREFVSSIDDAAYIPIEQIAMYTVPFRPGV